MFAESASRWNSHSILRVKQFARDLIVGLCPRREIDLKQQGYAGQEDHWLYCIYIYRRVHELLFQFNDSCASSALILWRL